MIRVEIDLSKVRSSTSHVVRVNVPVEASSPAVITIRPVDVEAREKASISIGFCTSIPPSYLYWYAAFKQCIVNVEIGSDGSYLLLYYHPHGFARASYVRGKLSKEIKLVWYPNHLTAYVDGEKIVDSFFSTLMPSRYSITSIRYSVPYSRYTYPFISGKIIIDIAGMKEIEHPAIEPAIPVEALLAYSYLEGILDVEWRIKLDKPYMGVPEAYTYKVYLDNTLLETGKAKPRTGSTRINIHVEKKIPIQPGKHLLTLEILVDNKVARFQKEIEVEAPQSPQPPAYTGKPTTTKPSTISTEKTLATGGILVGIVVLILLLLHKL